MLPFALAAFSDESVRQNVGAAECVKDFGTILEYTLYEGLLLSPFSFLFILYNFFGTKIFSETL